MLLMSSLPLLSFVIQLSDFGLAIASGVQHKNMKMSGTLGYVAPEYISHGIIKHSLLSLKDKNINLLALFAPFLNKVVVVLIIS